MLERWAEGAFANRVGDQNDRSDHNSGKNQESRCKRMRRDCYFDEEVGKPPKYANEAVVKPAAPANKVGSRRRSLAGHIGEG